MRARCCARSPSVPGDIPALIRTAFDARAAFGALRQCRRLLCAHLGFDSDDAIVHPEAAWPWEGAPASLFGGASPGDVQVENP